MGTLPNWVDKQATTILESVYAVLDQQCDVLSGFTTFVFGSVLIGGSGWADVDILLVANVTSDCDRLGQALEQLAETVPLHVTVVLLSEFNELGANAWGPLHKLMER